MIICNPACGIDQRSVTSGISCLSCQGIGRPRVTGLANFGSPLGFHISTSVTIKSYICLQYFCVCCQSVVAFGRSEETLVNFDMSLTCKAICMAVALSLAGCGPASTSGTSEGSTAEAAVDSAPDVDEAAPTPDEPRLTGPQRNAVRSANQYLSMTGFSRDGLIEQLSSPYGDGYEVTDATVAVDSLEVDWNENAARSARQYLEMTGFSCNGLIEQLSSSAGDKYTVEQATYGARQAGAC